MRFLYALVRPILCGSVCQICCGNQHHSHNDSDYSLPQFQCGQVYSFDGAPCQYPACDSDCLCKLLNNPAFLFSSYELLDLHVSPLMLSFVFVRTSLLTRKNSLRYGLPLLVFCLYKHCRQNDKCMIHVCESLQSISSPLFKSVQFSPVHILICMYYRLYLLRCPLKSSIL